jgi:hypothetical protein
METTDSLTSSETCTKDCSSSPALVAALALPMYPRINDKANREAIRGKYFLIFRLSLYTKTSF